MKKVILTTVACLFLSGIVYAQTPFLETFFESHAKQDGFTYIYAGKLFMNVNIPNNVKEMFGDIKYVKMLTYEKGNSQKLKSIRTQLSGIMRADSFELILKVEEIGEILEIYFKEPTKKDDGNVLVLMGDGIDLTIIWVNGVLKSQIKSK